MEQLRAPTTKRPYEEPNGHDMSVLLNGESSFTSLESGHLIIDSDTQHSDVANGMFSTASPMQTVLNSSETDLNSGHTSEALQRQGTPSSSPPSSSSRRTSLRRSPSSSRSDVHSKGEGMVHTDQPAKENASKAEISPNVKGNTNGVKKSKAKLNILGPLLYKPGEEFIGLKQHIRKKLIVHVKSKYLTSRNQQILERNLWGTTYYTDDSDVVSMLVHSGHMKLTIDPPPGFGIAVTLLILPGRDSYPPTRKGSLRSRRWEEHDVSVQVEGYTVFETRPSNWALVDQLDVPILEAVPRKPKARVVRRDRKSVV